MKPWIKNDLKSIGMIYNLPKHKLFLEEKNTLDFPGGLVVKIPPANAGDTASWSLAPHAVEKLSPCAAITEAHVP